MNRVLKCEKTWHKHSFTCESCDYSHCESHMTSLQAYTQKKKLYFIVLLFMCFLERNMFSERRFMLVSDVNQVAGWGVFPAAMVNNQEQALCSV